MTKCHVCEIGRVAANKGSASCIMLRRARRVWSGLQQVLGRSVPGERRTPLCEAHQRGTFQDSLGQAACLPCVPGKYQDQTEGTSCKLCAVNHFANETEMTKCHVCEIGRVAVPGIRCDFRQESSASLVRLAASARQVGTGRATHHLLCVRGLSRGISDSLGQAFALCARQVLKTRLRYVLQAVCSQPFCQRDRDDQMPCL